MYCIYNTGMKPNRIVMQFSTPTSKHTSTQLTPSQPTIPFQMTTHATSRFRMYTAMNDILYTPSIGGCANCGKKSK